MIAGDEILDDQSIRNIRNDAASGVGGSIPLDDIIFDDRGSIPSQEDAASKPNQTIVGDHIVEDLHVEAIYRRSPTDEYSTTGTERFDPTENNVVAGDGV